jgi:hypothetical protein
MFNFLQFYLFFSIFVSMHFIELFHASLVLILKHTQASRFGGELAICPKTIGQGSDA